MILCILVFMKILEINGSKCDKKELKSVSERSTVVIVE